MQVSELEDYVVVSNLLGNMPSEAKNSNEELLLSILRARLQSKYGLQLPSIPNPALFGPSLKHGGELFFEHFLERYNYGYSTLGNELTYHTVYNIQNKQFICFDHRLVCSETFKPNGLGLLLRQHFGDKDVPFKHINWPRVLLTPKRTLRDEYLLSKFKGMERPKVTKVRFYDD
jgi:hypothetical protein